MLETNESDTAKAPMSDHPPTTAIITLPAFFD